MLAYGKNVLYMTNPSSIKKVYISKTKQDKELEKSYASKCTYYIDREDSNLEEKLLLNTFEEGLKLQETELALDYTDYVFNSNLENLYKEEDFNEDTDY